MAIQQTKEECDAKIRKFNQLIRRYDPDPFEPDAVQNKEQEWSKELSNALDDLVDSIETMSVKHGHDLGSQEVAVWKKRITDSEGQFRNFTNKVAVKIRPLRSNTTTPSTNVPMPVAAPPDATNQSQAVSNALADVKVDAEMVATEGKELAAKVNKYLDWSDATNDEIELAMANIEGWQKKFTKIREKSFSIKRNTLKFNLDDLYLKRSEAVVNNLETELELAIEDITSEDKDRCLFSINKSKPADVKLPYFSGNKEEDFSKFRKEFEKGLKTNRVRKEDQIKKLREFLKGDAKTIIPNSMENIDTAWDILKSMYGDASRVMAARKRKIKDMGSFPRSGKPQVMLKNQIEWITKLEVTLNDIKELAEESAQMERDAYSSDMMHLIMSYFPNMIQKELQVEMENLPDDGKIRLQKILDYIVKHRKIIQGMLKTAEATVDHLSAGDGANGGGRGEPRGQHFRGSQTGSTDDSGSSKNKLNMKGYMSRMIPKSAVAFRPAQRDEKCRVCNALEGIGDTKDLYDNHTQSVAVGCPRFATMSMAKKKEIIKAAQVCDYCLDQNAVVKQGTLHAKCPVLEKKRFYSCAEDGCKTHFWLCDSPTHIQKNKKKIENSKRHWKDHGITYVHHATFHLGGVMKESPRDEGVIFEEKLPKDSEGVKAVFGSNNVPVQEENSKAHINQQVDESRVSLKDATEKLKKDAEGSTVLEVPEGDPLFLFSSAVGKTRSINIFYDKGCSHVVFKTGVPEQELSSVMTKRGPLNIGGVGKSTIMAKDEWACLLDRTDGCKQVVQGVTMDHITSPFPQINVSQAVKEIKADDPHNRELQDLKVPDMAGGEADVLLGILYQNCHPVIIHTLPCGLFIAKLKLASPNDEWTGVIGGPHRSFDMLANHVGDASRLIANFVDGLKDFQTLGAPKIHGPMMTWEDVNFAQRMSKAEIEDFTHQMLDLYGENEENDDKVAEFFESNIMCSSCGTDLDEDGILEEIDESTLNAAAKVNNVQAFAIDSGDNDEKLKDLKSLVKLQELGFSIDYRCPSCRSCSSCKNAPTTERLSMREEAEDQAIRDAVKIDFKKKKVTCTLPLRGKPEDFLSNNREVALKVLDSQCKKVQDDEEAKAAVIKSFYKLFDGGYAKRLEELTEEQQELILSQPVQHYLPWRVVHKQSISTPCRTVMDASSKTPLKQNGQGGRCLNDLTMKGRVNTLDLLNMLLRFGIGQVAFTGDLKQFYTSIALNPSQWNLQRVLWREGLSFKSKVEEIIILSLIFGVRAVSALSEKAIIMLAEYIRPRNPRLAELLLEGRFVDDLGDSDKDLKTVQNLIKAADELFESVGWSVKGYSVSGSNPHPDVTTDGVSVDVGGGMTWYYLIDCVPVMKPPIHFGKKSRGKLVVGSEFFDGSFEYLKKFVT